MRCPGSIVQACMKQTFVSTCRERRLAPFRFTTPSAAALSVHKTIVPEEQLHILLRGSLVAIPSQAPPTSAINSDSPELKQTLSCFLEEACTGHHVSSTEPLTQTAIPEVASTDLNVSSPISIESSPRPNLAECPQFQEHRNCNPQSCCTQDAQPNISASA